MVTFRAPRRVTTAAGALAAVGLVVASAAPANAQTDSLRGWPEFLGSAPIAATASAFGYPAALGIPVGSLAGWDTCWGVEPVTILPMTADAFVHSHRTVDGATDIMVSGNGLGATGIRYTLHWRNTATGHGGVETGETPAQFSLAYRHHHIHTGPGRIEWRLENVTAFSHNPGVFGPVLAMTPCHGVADVL